MIQFENVSMNYGNPEQQVLDQVSFHLQPSGMSFLTGKSGAGKTTILRLLLREIEPESGIIRVNGQDIHKIRASKLPQYRRKIGFVFQDYKLMRDHSVYDNVAIARRIAGAKEADTRSAVARALRVVGLEEQFYKTVDCLSGGEQQRVGIARAIVGNPYFILADEPTGNLDPQAAREIMLLFERIHKMGITLLVATHDEAAIRGMNYPVLRLQNGKVECMMNGE